MRSLIQPISGPRTVLFAPAPSPGDVFRILQPDRPAFSRSAISSLQEPTGVRTVSCAVLLSGPSEPGAVPWRVVCVAPQNEDGTADLAAGAFLGRLASRLSTYIDGTVYCLQVDTTGGWWVSGFTNGEPGNTDGEPRRSELWESFSRRHFGFGFKPAPLSPALFAWARETGVPLHRAPLRKAVKKIGRIIDYDAVAGLERKGLLIETAPIWYRFPIEITEGANEPAV